MNVPASELKHYADAAAEIRKTEDEKFTPPLPKLSSEELSQMGEIIRQAREVVRVAPDLFEYLARTTASRAVSAGTPTMSEACVYRAGFEDCLSDIKTIARRSIPDA